MVIKDVELDDGVWEVVGFDPTGAKIKMKVDAWSGAIIKLKRQRLAPSRPSLRNSRMTTRAGGIETINLFFAAIEAYIESVGASRLWR